MNISVTALWLRVIAHKAQKMIEILFRYAGIKLGAEFFQPLIAKLGGQLNHPGQGFIDHKIKLQHFLWLADQTGHALIDNLGKSPKGWLDIGTIALPDLFDTTQGFFNQHIIDRKST